MPTLTLRNLGYPSNSAAGAVAPSGVEVRAGVGPGPQGPPGAQGPAGAGGGTLAGDVTGASTGTTVARIQGRPVSATAPTNGQVLQWSGSAWTPVDPPAGPAAQPPTITSLNPNTGPAGGGTSVVITGTNFTGATAVVFGGTVATSYTVDSATQITAISPARAAGAAAVTVTTHDGTSAGVNFTYTAALVAPIITSANAANATEGTAFSYTITASGNPTPTTFNATGLPAWLSRTGAVVSGTPPAGSGNSSATFTVTATNSEGTSPGVLVTVAIAEPSMGWTVTYAYPVPPTVFNDETLIPLANFTGWSPAFNADMTDALYDAPTPAALPVNLWAKYSTYADFVLVPFDNWGPNPSGGNKIMEWGYHSGSHSIYIWGNNATGQPIQLRLVKT